MKIHLEGIKLKCNVNKSKLKAYKSSQPPKFKDSEHLIKVLNSLVKRTEKKKKKVFKSKARCSKDPESLGVTAEDVKYMIEVLCLVNPLFDNISGYFEELEDQLSNQKIESLNFYAGYGMELNIEFENVGLYDN